MDEEMQGYRVANQSIQFILIARTEHILYRARKHSILRTVYKDTAQIMLYAGN